MIEYGQPFDERAAANDQYLDMLFHISLRIIYFVFFSDSNQESQAIRDDTPYTLHLNISSFRL